MPSRSDCRRPSDLLIRDYAFGAIGDYAFSADYQCHCPAPTGPLGNGSVTIPAQLPYAGPRGLKPHAFPLDRPADLIEDRRIVDGRRHGPGLAVGDLLHGAA